MDENDKCSKKGSPRGTCTVELITPKICVNPHTSQMGNESSAGACDGMERGLRKQGYMCNKKDTTGSSWYLNYGAQVMFTSLHLTRGS